MVPARYAAAVDQGALAMMQPKDGQAPATAPEFVFPQEAEDALARGEVLQAIRVLRAANRHLDLKSAKAAIESHAASAQAAAPRQGQATPRQPRVPTVVEGDGGNPKLLLVVVLVVVAAGLWWLFGGA